MNKKKNKYKLQNIINELKPKAKNNLNNKLNILGLEEHQIEQIKNLHYEEYEFFEKDILEINEDVINDVSLDYVIGSSRCECSHNWIECLDKLHKDINFKDFSLEKFIDILNQKYDYPELYSYKNKYYIGGNGKHRITIAKCLGIEKIRASIIYYN